MTARTLYIGTENTDTPPEQEMEELEILLGMIGIPAFKNTAELQAALRPGASVRAVSLTVEFGEVYSNNEGDEA